MAPNSNWDAVMAANIDEIQELDEASIADWCSKVEELDADSEEDPEKLKKAFAVAQTLMVIKILENEDKEKGYKDEIAKLKKLGGDGGDSVDHTRMLRQELESAERQSDLVKTELRDKERVLERERTRADELEDKVKSLRSQHDELQKENERQRADIEEYIKRLKTVTDAGQGRHHDDLALREKLQEKNRELVNLNDEYMNIVSHNQKLEEELSQLQQRMDSATSDMNKITDDYINLKTVLQDSDGSVDNLRKDNEKLKVQVQDLTEQIKSKMDGEDEIMVAVNNKIEEWKKLLATKDSELLEYREQVISLRERITAMSMDKERVKMAALEKGVEERDTHIRSLQEKLQQATDDLEQANALIEDLRAQLNREFSGPGASDIHLKKIKQLQGTLDESTVQSKGMRERLKKAEQDVQEKEKELNELTGRMRQYESETYGLSDAVAEIKDCRLQLQIRDRQIFELTQNVNDLGNQLNDQADENEELRERLGLGPKTAVDLTEQRKRKHIRKEEERAMNQILQKEVERLEEERLELKQQIRKLAQHTGQRAVALGLSSDDILAIEEFTETLKRKKSLYDPTAIKKDAETDELKVRALQLAQESEKYQKDMERIRQTNAELNLKIREKEEENRNLEQGMKELLQSVKESNNRADGAVVNIESPTIERMLAAIEAKQITGNYDAALHLKAQVDNLTGRNEELRRELRESRFECTKVKLELEKSGNKINKLEGDMKIIKDAGGMGMLFQTLTLPEGMAVSSADVIASLNEHLVQTLHELSEKEAMLSNMEQGLETYKSKFSVVRHQLGLLYKQHQEEYNAWQQEKERLDSKIKELEGSISEDKVKIQEYDRMVDTLAQDESEMRRRLADMARKATVLRVNEKALTRRYATMQEIEASLRKEVTKLRNETIAMETAVTERLGYLQRYKDMASFKISSLQKTREESVPLAELELANKQYQDLTEKYRDLLERSNTMIAKNERSATLEMELKRLQNEKEGLAKELEIEKEKTHTYQASLDQLHRQGISTSGTLDHDAQVMAKKMATLEMKEINERQRAEHAMRMYEQRKEMLDELEARNTELEQKFAEVTKMNLEAQRTERILRDELSNCVLKSVSDADRARIDELESSENSLKIENSRLKEIADVALTQASSMEQQKVSQEKELLSLRQQLIDIQSQSDEKKVIGKLHRHIVLLQVSEGTAVKKLEDATKKITKLQAQLLRTEQRLDEKDQSLLHHRAETANKARHLRRTIHELRRMFSGSVPLSKQERFAKAMVQLQADKDSFAQQLKQVTEDRQAIEDRLSALNIQYASLQELIATLKDGKGASKVVEWHKKMENLRLEELKKSRQIQRLSEQVAFSDTMMKQHEVTISNMEEEHVKLSRQYEERQLQWEQREMEMERIINKLEHQQQEIAGAASKFEAATGSFPDITLPVTDQLEQAIATIKNNIRVIIETQAESKKIKQTNAELEVKIKEADANLLSRDRLISELRLRLPATAERDAAIANATANAQYQEEQYETKQALRVAQSTLSSLQARINQKEETISKLQTLLQQSRDEMKDTCNKYETELKLMMDRLHIKSDDAFVKFKQTAIGNANQQSTVAPSSKQLARLNELEDTVVHQDNQIGALSEKIRSLQAEVAKWRQREENTTVQLGKEKDKMIEEHHVFVQKLDKENDDLRQQLAEKTEAMAELNIDLEKQKQAAKRGPSAAAKEQTNRLKQQLQDKEEELQRMSKALTELRAELVDQAVDAVKANASTAAQDWNIQKLIDKRTKVLKDKIEDLETDLEKARGKKQSDKETSLRIENEELKDELAKKETMISKLKESKRRLEEENEALEKRIDRISTSKVDTSGKQTGGGKEVESLRNQVKLLEKQLSESKMRFNRAEKPSEDSIRSDTQKSFAVEKWGETKKYQQLLEKAKAKLKTVEADRDKLKANNDLMKNALDRANKVRETLEKKTYKNAPPVSSGVSSNLNEQELRDQNELLHTEISDLRQQLLMTRDVAYEEVQMRNRQLTDKLEQLEKALQKKKNSDGLPTAISSEEYAALVEKEQKLQDDVIKLNNEKVSLVFEVTQLQQEIPKLKEKIESQKQYIELLKMEKGKSMVGTARSVNSWVSGSDGSSIRKIGDSGRTPKELEKTISLLKKVVEKKQSEIDQLKMAPGVVSNERLFDLERENEGLREQLNELRSKMGATLSERYEMKDKGTKKLTIDYERLRQDLRKEQESGEKLRVALNSARLSAEQHAKTIEELKTKLAISESKSSSTSKLDHKGWKAAVVTRMSEEKLVRVTAELENKNKALADVKVLLRDSATREKSLLNEKDELERKISILERFPPGAKLTDSEVVAQLQQAKLTMQRLEDEKAELLREIRKMKGHTVADAFDETVVEKARKYDSALRDQVETATKLERALQERDDFKKENEKMKRELANFGPEFFDEIEDLKYNYREAEIKNAQLEEQMNELRRRSGV